MKIRVQIKFDTDYYLYELVRFNNEKVWEVQDTSFTKWNVPVISRFGLGLKFAMTRKAPVQLKFYNFEFRRLWWSPWKKALYDTLKIILIFLLIVSSLTLFIIYYSQAFLLFIISSIILAPLLSYFLYRKRAYEF